MTRHSEVKAMMDFDLRSHLLELGKSKSKTSFVQDVQLKLHVENLHYIAKKWYDNLAVQWEMFYLLKKKREFAMLNPNFLQGTPFGGYQHRNVNVWKIQVLGDYLYQKFLHNKQSVYNCFYSMATFDNLIPFFKTYEEFKDFKTSAWKMFANYDLAIDIDAPSHKHIDYALESCVHAKSILDKYDIAHDVRFSGKGFHIVVPGAALQFKKEGDCVSEHWFEPHNSESVYEVCANTLKYLHDVAGEFIDYSIADSRRVLKIPYSLSFYNDSYAVCWPLTLRELSQFSLRKYMNDNVFDLLPSIRERNIFMFNRENEADPSYFESFYNEEVMPHASKAKDNRTR